MKISMAKGHDFGFKKKLTISNLQISPEELYEVIIENKDTTTKGGNYIAPGNYKNNHKIVKNAYNLQLIGIDYDDAGTFDSIESISKKIPFAHIIYETASSTLKKRRLRVITYLNEPIGSTDFKDVYNYIANKTDLLINLKHDEACKDSARIHYTYRKTIEGNQRIKEIIKKIELPIINKNDILTQTRKKNIVKFKEPDFKDLDPEENLKALFTYIKNAKPGERNNILFWGACRIGELIKDNKINAQKATKQLLNLAKYLDQGEETVYSALNSVEKGQSGKRKIIDIKKTRAARLLFLQSI